jgi:hypothetical protein
MGELTRRILTSLTEGWWGCGMMYVFGDIRGIQGGWVADGLRGWE